MLHQIFQRIGISPDEVMDKPPGVQAFMLASMQVQLESEIDENEKN